MIPITAADIGFILGMTGLGGVGWVLKHSTGRQPPRGTGWIGALMGCGVGTGLVGIRLVGVFWILRWVSTIR